MDMNHWDPIWRYQLFHQIFVECKEKHEIVTAKIASSAIQCKDYQLIDTSESSNVMSINEEEDFVEPVINLSRGKSFSATSWTKLAKDAATKSPFHLQNIKDNDKDVKYYTDYATLLTFFEVLLGSDVTVMHQWDGKNCKLWWWKQRWMALQVAITLEIFSRSSETMSLAFEYDFV